MNTASALVERLQHYVPLQPDERDALDWLERGGAASPRTT
jgi:hypothetical protein